jgi:hypothetical protein
MSTEAMARGERAGRELAETEAAFAAVRAAMVKRLLESPLNAGDERERLYHAVQSLDAVRAALRQVVDAGKIEAAARDAAEAVAKN